MELTPPSTPINVPRHDGPQESSQAGVAKSMLSPFDMPRQSTNDDLVKHDYNLSQYWADDARNLAQASKSKVAVLLFAWREGEGRYTVSTSKLLRDLHEVLDTQYNFLVQTETLTTTGDPPRFQLTTIISQFLQRYARPNTLLIIHYVGHGNLSPDEQDLILRGGNANRKNPIQTELNWSDVEFLLHRIQADLLLLFDCCHAGLIARRAARWSNSGAQFEFMGSTTKDKTARGPKDRASFTKSLISALRHLSVQLDGFDTRTLLHTIENNSDFQDSNQQPVLSSGGATTSQDKLWIRPLPVKPTFGVEDEQVETLESVKFYLQFNYVFTQQPSEADLTLLKQSLWNLIRHQGLPIQDVHYGGLSKHETRMDMRDAARLFLLKMRDGRSKLPEGKLEVLASEESTSVTTQIELHENMTARTTTSSPSRPPSLITRTTHKLQRTLTQPEVVFSMEWGPTIDSSSVQYRRLSFDVLVLVGVAITWWLMWQMS